jgi:predicted dehydrogenase
MELKAGVIGCGEMGKIHTECLSGLDGMKMTAFCDVNLESAKKLYNEFGGDYYTGDIEKILKDDSLSAVYICTYHNTHADLAKKCCAYGRNVMMEKPLALTIKENYEVAEAVEKSKILFMVGLKARFYPSVKKAKEFISSPLVTIGQMIDTRWDDNFWANDPLRGGGNVLSQGCHTMDLIYYLNNSEPENIFAFGGNLNHPQINIIDNITATIKFKNGSVASVTQGDSGFAPLVSKFSFQIFDGVRSVHLYNRLKSAKFYNGEKVLDYEDDKEYGFMEENKYFISCLENKILPEVSWKDGLRATLMILKAFESIKTGLPQKIEL